MKTRHIVSSAEGRSASASGDRRNAAVKESSAPASGEVVRLLLKATKDPDYSVREEAFRDMGALPQEAIFPRLEDFLRDKEHADLRAVALDVFPRYGKKATHWLLRLLKDQDKEVRMFAAILLGEVRDPGAVDDLIEALRDPDDNVRHESAEGLGKIRDARAVGPLIDCLRQDFWIQYPAVVALGRIGDLSATRHLIPLLTHDRLRHVVIEALGRIGDVSVLPIMADILSHKDSSLRNDTIASLVNIQQLAKPNGDCLPGIRKALKNGEMVDHLIHSLQDRDTGIRRNAVIVLGWIKERRAVQHLVKLITCYELEEYVKGALISIGDGAIPGLIEELQDPDPAILAAVIQCIEWIGNEEGIRACIPLLRHEDNNVRYQAVMAMAKSLHAEDVEDALIGMLSDPRSDIQGILVDVLGHSRSRSLVARLIPGLSSREHSRRVLTIQILGRLKSPQAFEPLRNLLQDQDPEIKAQAYMAFSAIQADQLLDLVLTKGIKQKRSSVRKAVARCLSVGSGESLKDTLLMLLRDPDSDVRIAAIETLGRIGDVSCIRHLIENFPDLDKQMRVAIVQAIGNTHDKEGPRFLARLLKERDPDMKRVALESLGKIGNTDSIPAITNALDDPHWSVRHSAIQALARIGDPGCTGDLLEKLDDPEGIVRKEAIVALGLLGSRDAACAILPLVNQEGLQSEVLGSIEKLGIPDIEQFQTIYTRSNTRLKCRLIDLAVTLKDVRVVDFLLEILDKEIPVVRSRIVTALGELGDEKAVPALRRIRKEDPDREVRKEAGLALKRHAKKP